MRFNVHGEGRTGCGPSLSNVLLDGILLLMRDSVKRGAKCQQQAAPCVENGADAHRQRMLRHRFDGTEDLAVILQRLLGENLDPRA